MPEATPLRFLALGDSYTIGEGVPPAASWPMQLAARLHDAGIAIDEPRIIATTGWTTDELSAAMDAADPRGPFDLVSLGIGVNNQYRGRGLDEYARQFQGLLERAIALAGGQPCRVFVPSIPDWGGTPFAFAQGADAACIGQRIDAFNLAARAMCADHGVAFVDVTGISREPRDAGDWLTDDGLHPSAAQYAHWAQALLPVVLGSVA